MKYVLKGAGCTGKTTALREWCIHLTDELHIPGNSILVLVGNKAQLYDWNSYISEKSSSKPLCRTFSGFIREELTIFYPLTKCRDIFHKDIRPSFLSPDAAIHLISKVIQARREKDGIFASLVSSNERIAAVIANNLSEAALEGIPANEICQRLYEAIEKKDDIKKSIFEDMDRVLMDYRAKCLEIGALDYGMIVELYSEYLLNDEKYRQLLSERIRHIIVDDIQECPTAEIVLVELLLSHVESALLSYDDEYSNWELAHESGKIIEKRLLSNCVIREMDTLNNRNAKMLELAESLHSSIMAGGAIKQGEGFPVERRPEVELRSEMLEQLGECVCSLIDADGYKPSDIAIISTYADIVTELVIGNIIGRKGHKLVNAVSRQNISDSSLCSSMLVFAKLCHPEYRLFPEKDKVKFLVEMLFGLNPVISAKIARKTVNTFPFPKLPQLEELGDAIFEGSFGKERYCYVVDWIGTWQKQEKERTSEISGFLQAALMEIFLSDKYNDEEFEKAKMLIDNAETYSRTVSKFNRKTGRDFIEMAEKLVKASENSFYQEEKLNGEHVILTTPAAYLSGTAVKKIVIICSLSSRNWSPARARQLTNQRVLGASWEKDKIYTSYQEDIDSKRFLAAMIRALVKKCSERIITFESQLSENGYENDGILSDVFDG